MPPRSKWPGQESDATALATRFFPAGREGRVIDSDAQHLHGGCTWPSRFRYEPIRSDREALRRIVEQSDVIEAKGRAWLLIELTESLEDYLAAFDAADEDDEDEGI